MKFHIITFGCQMNRSDSERLTTVLKKCGHLPTVNKDKSDLIVINLCSIRQSAVDRVYGLISNIKNKKIILTGCLLPKDKEKLKDKVDLIFNISQLANLPQMLSRININSSNNLAIGQFSNYLSIDPQYSTFPSAYVPIMTGCDNFCSYCVVPYTRNREISRPVEEIIREVKNLIKKGYKEIILLGQNVNSYKSQILNSNFQTNSNKIQNSKLKTVNFPRLLKMINDLEGNFWLTFITSHPKDFSDKLIEIMAKSEKVMPYLHLPVQSGDNEILKRMNRRYNVVQYKKLIKKIRDKFAKTRKGFEKNICLSTDIIVGFPDETKKQFQNTVKLMKEIKFDMVYLAKYSPRPGTAAALLKDSVSFREKERRWKILAEILKKTALENNQKYLGKIVEVLIKKFSLAKTLKGGQKNGYLFGQTKNFKNVKIDIRMSKKSKNLIGKFVKVKIIKITSFGLKAEKI